MGKRVFSQLDQDIRKTGSDLHLLALTSFTPRHALPGPCPSGEFFHEDETHARTVICSAADPIAESARGRDGGSFQKLEGCVFAAYEVLNQVGGKPHGEAGYARNAEEP